MTEGEIDNFIKDGPWLVQQEGEPHDFFAMRAFLVALNRVDYGRACAMVHWIVARGTHELQKRQSAAPQVER